MTPTTPFARVRPATVLDAGPLAEAHRTAWWETYGEVVPAEAHPEPAESARGWWEAALSDPDGPTTWVAVRDGAVVGFSRAVAPGAGNVRPLELQLLYVLAAEQGRRTGTHLLQMAVGDAPCALWVAAHDLRAQGFFRHHGFGLDGTREQRWGGLTVARMLR
ncbi:GNAT family N-acetyltransferase [Georgenia sp. 10Sc9-8]|uniref:GNAT family N-acetyltransferase n=1 Tax=Georgenia halotolerans TaxID=3028317 RepID=A0ABT5U4B2_9MICO|nr:GNAT family N-acetyltransferase [Georgenia halotolerans]